MPTIGVPADWPDIAAPVANLLAHLGHPWIWWAISGSCLIVGLALHRRRSGVALALAVTASLSLGITADGLVDDAYIQFRYAAQLASGHGPVMNPGERVEGASGGLWIGALAIGTRLTGIECGIVGRALGLLVTPIATLLAGLALRVRSPPAGALAALAWAALPTPALYAATGLETSAAMAALWLVAWAIATGRSRAAAVGAVLVVGFRPETPLLALVVLPWWRRLQRPARTAVVSALAMTAALTLARMAYYGEPVPHSALVKAATAPGIMVGISYLSRLVLEAGPLLLTLPWLVTERRLRPALVAGAIAAAAVAVGGGDWMPGTRYLLPVLVLVPIATALAADRTRLPSMALAAQGVLCLLLLAPISSPAGGIPGSAWRQMTTHRIQCRWWEALGHWLRRRVPSQWTVATGPAGALPYASGLRTFDLLGLATPVSGTRQGWVGHRAWGLSEALARRVELVYGVEATPQSSSVDELRHWVMETGRRHPRLGQGWQAVLIVHRPVHPLDILSDVIWVRRDLLEGLGTGPPR